MPGNKYFQRESKMRVFANRRRGSGSVGNPSPEVGRDGLFAPGVDPRGFQRSAKSDCCIRGVNFLFRAPRERRQGTLHMRKSSGALLRQKLENC